MNDRPIEDPPPPGETPKGSFILDDLTNVFESLPDRLDNVRAVVAASEGFHPTETARHQQVGQSILNLVTSGMMPDLSNAFLNSLAGWINPEALGRWYVGVFPDAPRWPMQQWADIGGADPEVRDQMRLGLIDAAVMYAFSYVDETVVFEYLNQVGVDFGDPNLEYSALGIAKLFERRLVGKYAYVEDVADAWIEVNDVHGLYRELDEAASERNRDALSDMKASFARTLMGRNRELCWIDRLEDDHGRLWCFKRHDDTATDLV